MYTRRAFPIILALFMVMILAACGSSTSTSTSTGSSSNPTPTQAVATPTTASPSPTATTSGSTSSALVQTATATVGGKSETILTDSQGKTLYYFTADTATTSACTSGCAQTWPPLLSTGSGTPTSANPLSGKLATLTTANGNQVTYNGHLLYTYAGDTAPGDTKGEGLFGKWFVCTPTLK